MALAPITSIDLSIYQLVGRYDLPEPTRTAAPANNLLAQEVSAVTYNADTDTLFVLGDGGTAIVQVSKTGALINSMTLATGTSPQNTEFYDPEGLTYIGQGRFVMTEERDRQLIQFTYVPDTVLTRAAAQTVKLGTTIGNTGFEGLSYDPQTGGYIVVKEITPLGIFQTSVDFAAGTASNGSPTATGSTNLFDPGLVGTADFADVFALSNLTALAGQSQSGNLLVLSQASGRIVNIDRAGNIASSLTIVSNPSNPLSVPNQQHEGLTMGADGTLYVVSENGGGDFDHPQLWVYQAAQAANQAPTALALINRTTTIAENTATASRIKVADVAITDDGIGTNTLTLTGADAAAFEVDVNGLYIKVGTVLDFETKASYAVTVNVDDTTVGTTPDATSSYSLTLIDVMNETPALPVVSISEVAAWSSGNSPVAADWFEVTNNGPTALDIAGWKFDDNSNLLSAAVTLNGITSIAAGESVIFLDTANLAATGPIFLSTWFGASPPAGLRLGSYSGAGVGLSTGGDAVNLYNAAGALQANIVFGASPTGPYATFNNATGLTNATIGTLSQAGINGAVIAANDPAEVGSPGGVGRLFVSEVAPWSSANSPVAADWFELTNDTGRTIDITGWKFDNNSGSAAAGVALSGITSIAAGESVIFLESASLATIRTSFVNTWFGGTAPAGLQVGHYTGAGVGLGASGDAVHIYNAANVLQASVAFGASPTGPFATFDNGAGLNGSTIATLSVTGTRGAFVAVADPAEIGSPGGLRANAALVPGTPGNDALGGGAAGDLLLGGVGDDQLFGLGGADTLSGGAGNDVLYGGTGNDSMAGGTGNDAYIIDDAGDLVQENAGEGFDTAFVLANGWTQGAGIELSYLYGSANSMTGSMGDDVLVTNGGAGSSIDGGLGDDTLWGQAGNDTLIGGGGQDVLRAGDGNDVLRGGLGADQLVGGAGADLFAYDASGWGYDQIFDFSIAEGDKLDFRGSGLGFAQLTLYGAAGSTVVQAGADRIDLYGVANLTPGDFLFA